MDKQTPKINMATLTEDQRTKLDAWQQAHDQLRTLNDIANIVQDISTVLDDQKKTGGDLSKETGALLMDMRDSLNELKSKEDPETPDFSTPVVTAVNKLEKALGKLDLSPVIKVDAPQVNVSPPIVDLRGVEKAVKGLDKAFGLAIKGIPKPEKTDNSDLIKVWEGISEQLESIENATRMKPLPGSMSIKGVTITNGKIPVDVDMATYSKVNETTLKVSTVVEQEITLDQLEEERARLNQMLGQLEQQYQSQKADIMVQLEMANKAMKEAVTLKLVSAADVKAEAIEEPVEELIKV